MKNLKKILALMLVLAMTVCVFTACGDDKAETADKEDTKTEEKNKDDDKEDKEDKEDEDKEDENKEVDVVADSVEAEVEAAFDATMEEQLNYVSEIMESQFATEIGDESAASAVVSAYMSMCSYSVDNVEVNGDIATVTYTMTAPDMDNVEIPEVDESASVDERVSITLDVMSSAELVSETFEDNMQYNGTTWEMIAE